VIAPVAVAVAIVVAFVVAVVAEIVAGLSLMERSSQATRVER
jgi:hypothetical protein